MTGAQGAMGPIADALAATGMVGLARAAALAPGAQAAPRTTTGAGLFVPVGCGALALGVLALGVPLHFNAVALGPRGRRAGRGARPDGARAEREPRAARREPG